MPTEMVYLDASCLFRLYWQDSGWESVRAFCAKTSGLACAWHGRPEVLASAHRKVREGVATPAHLAHIIAQVRSDTDAGGLHWLALTPAVLRQLEDRYRTAPPTLFLRAADALHLACAAEHGFRDVYSNDRHFLAAAPHFGLRGINLIPPGA